jgi:dTDP-4-amino-4,6-dideoxygalactose transaminase
MIKDHGQEKKYYHQMEGFNGRLDAIQAAVLRIKLNHLPSWNESRRQNARYYNDLLAETPGIALPIEREFATSVYHLYVIHLEDRDELQKHLNAKGIATGLHYPVPLHLQDAYRHLEYPEGTFPVSENSAAHLLSLPMFPELKKEQIEYVADHIIHFMKK